ncbi:MAG: hypothetical protein Q4G40_02260 [Brachybacterium sp.]|nr:hypothetical protein [Brachybacterium sp.]
MSETAPGTPDTTGTASLPALRSRQRRWWLGQLALLGLGQVLLASLCGWALIVMQNASEGPSSTLLRTLALLVLAALGIGELRRHEVATAARLGDDYEAAVRRQLLENEPHDGHGASRTLPSARATTELERVRSWITHGVAPLVVAVPLLSGTLVVLALLDPVLMGAMAAPLALLLLVVTLRRHSQSAIRSAGILTSLLCVLLVTALGTAAQSEPGTILAATAMAAVASAPLLTLGCITELHEDYRRARSSLLDHSQRMRRARERSARRRQASGELFPPPSVHETVLHTYIDLPGLSRPGHPLHAGPGEVVRVVADDPTLPRRFLRRVAELEAPADDRLEEVWSAGVNLRALTPEEVGQRLGHAASGTVVAGPATAEEPAQERTLRRVGLDPARMPDNLPSVLRRGAHLLNRSDRARLALARAVHGDPPLLLLDHVAEDLDEDGRGMLADLVLCYPGVVVLACEDAFAEAVGARTLELLDDPRA